MKPILIIYLIVVIAGATLPINGTSSTLNNNYILSIRWDYIVHVMVYMPLFPLLNKTLNLKTKSLDFKAIIVAVLLATTLEAIQYIIPWRAFNVNDLISNILGVGIGVLLWTVIKNNKIILPIKIFKKWYK